MKTGIDTVVVPSKIIDDYKELQLENAALKAALKDLVYVSGHFLGAYYDPTSLAAIYQTDLKATIEKAKKYLYEAPRTKK